MAITTITPIAMPRIVRKARTLLPRSESSAMPTPSSTREMFMDAAPSFGPERGDGVEPGGPARGIDAGHDAHRHADEHPEADRPRRHGGRQRRERLDREGESEPEAH